MTSICALYKEATDNQIVVYDDVTFKKREAISIQDDDGSCVIAIDRSKVQSEADERVKLSHELGHCLTGSFYNQYSVYDIRQKHENRADRWAIERTISEDDLDAAVANGLTELWELAEFFGVPEDFMRKAVCFYTNGNLATELYFA